MREILHRAHLHPYRFTPITALCTQKKGLQKDVSNSDPNMKASCGVGLIFNCGMAESTRQIQSKGLSTGGAVHFNERNGDTILVVNANSPATNLVSDN